MKIYFLRFLFSLLSFFVLVNPSATYAQVNFGTPEQISTVGVTSVTTSGPQIAKDGNGNAVATWLDSVGGNTVVAVSVYQYPVGWGPVSYLSLLADNSIYPVVACNNAGKAIVAWIDTSVGQVQSSSISNILTGTWTSPIAASASGLTFNGNQYLLSIAIAPSTTDLAIIAWEETDSGPVEQIYANTFTFGTGLWGLTPQHLSTTGNDSEKPSATVSSNGNGFVIWNDGLAAKVLSATYISGIWTTYTLETAIFPALILNVLPSIGSDNQGNAVALWSLFDGTNYAIRSAHYSNSLVSWSTASTIASGSNHAFVYTSIAVNGAGNAYATWFDFINSPSLGIWGAYYTGGVWTSQLVNTFNSPSGPVNLSAGINDSSVGVIVYNSGPPNSVIYGAYSTNQGVTWSSPATIVSEVDDNLYPVVVLDNSNNAIVAWLDDITNAIYASAGVQIPSTSPLFVGTVVKNVFLSGTEYVHSLAWLPSTDPTVVGYHLYRNGVLIATFPLSGPFKYLDRNRSEWIPDVYVLKTFDSFGVESNALTVTLPKPKRHHDDDDD